MPRFFLRLLLFPLALFFVFEGWLWETLAPLVAWFVAVLPFRWLKAAIAGWIEKLPPGPTLIVFLIPVLLLLPFKLAGLKLLSEGKWLEAAGVLAMAKLLGMGVTAFLFDLTRPKLLELAWFRVVYQRVNSLLAAAHALVDPLKREIRRWLRFLKPNRASRALRLISRLRQRMQREKRAG